MLETPHVIVGAAIAAKITNPLLSIPLAFGSHFILDMVPHWNPHINTELKNNGKVSKQSISIIVGDLVLAGASALAIAHSFSTGNANMAYIFAGGVAGIMPDVVEGPYFFLGWKNKLIKGWLSFQKSIQTDVSVVPGVLTQIATMIAAIWWLYN